MPSSAITAVSERCDRGCRADHRAAHHRLFALRINGPFPRPFEVARLRASHHRYVALVPVRCLRSLPRLRRAVQVWHRPEQDLARSPAEAFTHEPHLERSPAVQRAPPLPGRAPAVTTRWRTDHVTRPRVGPATASGHISP